MEEKTVIIKGEETRFSVSGEGFPILILHGWGSSLDSWKEIQQKLSENNYRVFCPDLPGFGKTKPPKTAWGVSDYVDWVLEFTETQKLNQFILLGHSFGGRISIKFANYYPNKIKDLILCDSAGLKVDPSFNRKMVLGIVGLFKLVFGITLVSKIKQEMKDLLLFSIANTDYGKASKIMKGVMKRVIAEDLMVYLKGIEPRTLIVWGEKDKLVPVEHAYIFKSEIKDSKLEIIPNIGHSPHLKSPEKLFDIISNFLNSK